MGWGRRIAGVALAAIVLVTVSVLVLSFARARAATRFAQDYPPPGQLYDVGGHRLHMSCVGAGEPTVVFEAGYIDFSLAWSQVQPLVAQETRACSYDRAGLLWSQPAERSYDLDEVSRQLGDLLDSAGIDGPIVLVGHSLGGLVAMHRATRHEGGTAGLVLVDATTPFHDDVPDDLLALMLPVPSDGVFRAARLLSATGLLRLLPVDVLGPEPSLGQPRELREVYAAAWARLPHQFDVARDASAVTSSFPAAMRAAGLERLREVPLVYLFAGGTADPGPEQLALRERIEPWRRGLAERTVALSSAGRLVRVDGASHDIHYDHPEAVAEVVLELVAQARAQPVAAEGAD